MSSASGSSSLPLVSFVGFVLLTFVSGVLTAFQHGMNTKFKSLAGHAVHGGIVNFAVGLLTVLVFWAVLARGHVPSRAIFTLDPWWLWLGGVCGGIYVCVAVLALPRIGGVYYVSALVIGQLAAAALIDHFGLVGLPVKHVSPGRVIGLALMIAGLVCMKIV